MKRRAVKSKVVERPTKDSLLRKMTGRPAKKLSFWQKLIKGIIPNRASTQKGSSATTRGTSFGWGSAELAEKRTASTAPKSVWDMFQHRPMSAAEEASFDRLSGEVTDLQKYLKRLRDRGCTNAEIKTLLPKKLGKTFKYSTSALKEIIVNAGLAEELKTLDMHYDTTGKLVKGGKV